MSLEEVGRLEGVSPQPLRRLFRKHGLVIRKGGRPAGVTKSGAGLSATQEARLVQLYQDGWSQARLATELGCTRSVIARRIHKLIPASERRHYSGKTLTYRADSLLVCRDCGEAKSPEDFYNNSTSMTGKMAYCKKCALHRNRRYTYGVSPEDYDRLSNKQGGCCAICGAAPVSKRNRKKHHLCVDHDHQTGRVRGLLCVACNHAIGLFKDHHEWLQKAAEYVKSPQAEPDAP